MQGRILRMSGWGIPEKAGPDNDTSAFDEA
jgi:hypothetical protein